MNTDCTFYDKGTGEITGTASVSEETAEMYFRIGCAVRLDAVGDPAKQYVDLDTLELIDFTADEITARANLRVGWIWRMPERRPVDLRAPEQVRSLAIERINAERDRRIAAFDRFTFNGVLYDGDQAAKENITDAAAGAADDQPLPAGFTWRSFDNTDVPMTNADILAMAKAFRAAANLHKFTMHAIARALKDGAEGDLTNEQLDAITWPE